MHIHYQFMYLWHKTECSCTYLLLGMVDGCCSTDNFCCFSELQVCNSIPLDWAECLEFNVLSVGIVDVLLSWNPAKLFRFLCELFASPSSMCGFVKLGQVTLSFTPGATSVKKSQPRHLVLSTIYIIFWSDSWTEW